MPNPGPDGTFTFPFSTLNPSTISSECQDGDFPDSLKTMFGVDAKKSALHK